MLNLNRYVIVIVIVLVLSTMRTLVYYGLQNSNIITIYTNSVIWRYNTNGTGIMEHVVLDIDRQGFHYIKQSGNSVYGRSSTKLSIVLIGNERMYYQYTYSRENFSLSIDSNIVVNKRYVVVQWLNIEMKLYTNQYVNKSYHRFLFPKTIVLQCLDRNITINMNYAFVKVNYLKNTTLVKLSIYDIQLDTKMYSYYLAKCLSINKIDKLSNALSYFNTTYIPMYAKVDTYIASVESIELLDISVQGLSLADIYNAFIVLPWIIPTLNISLGILYGVDLPYEEKELLENMKSLDFVAQTLNLIYTYVQDKLVLLELVEHLMNRYSLQDPSIKVELNKTVNNISIYMELREQGVVNMTKDEVLQLLTEIVRTLNSAGLRLVGIENELYRARLEDLRHALSQQPNDARMWVVISALALTVVQVCILVSAMLYVFKRWKRYEKPSFNKPLG